jgi:hypothetical protein
MTFTGTDRGTLSRIEAAIAGIAVDQQARIDAAVADQKAADDLVLAGVQESLREALEQKATVEAALILDDEKVAQLTQTVSDLRQQLADCEAEHDPTFNTLLGTERGVTGMSLEAAHADLEQRVGVHIPLHHTYDLSGKIPTSIAATPAGGCVGKHRVMLGIHYDPAAPDFAAAQSLAASVPDDTFLILWHEWDAHQQDPATIAHTQNALYDAIKAVKPSVQVWACVTGWFFDAGNKSGMRDAYAAALDPTRIDGVASDAYQRYLFPPAGSKTVWDPAPTPQMVNHLAWCKALGVRCGIAETCCASDATHPVADKLKWWNDLVAWAEANDLAFITYFDTEINQDVGPGSMIEDQPEFAAAWAAQVAARA